MSNFATLRDELLAEIETIAPVVRECASQSEQLGRLAEPIIKAARQTSLLRLSVRTSLAVVKPTR